MPTLQLLGDVKALVDRLIDGGFRQIEGIAMAPFGTCAYFRRFGVTTEEIKINFNPETGAILLVTVAQSVCISPEKVADLTVDEPRVLSRALALAD